MMKLEFDYSKLKGKIREVFNTQSSFAEQLGISTYSLYKKLSKGVSFTQTEIIKSSKLLNIEAHNIPLYFFTEKVEKTQ